MRRPAAHAFAPNQGGGRTSSQRPFKPQTRTSSTVPTQSRTNTKPVKFGSLSKIACFRCGKKGHLAAERKQPKPVYTAATAESFDQLPLQTGLMAKSDSEDSLIAARKRVNRLKQEAAEHARKVDVARRKEKERLLEEEQKLLRMMGRPLTEKKDKDRGRSRQRSRDRRRHEVKREKSERKRSRGRSEKKHRSSKGKDQEPERRPDRRVKARDSDSEEEEVPAKKLKQEPKLVTEKTSRPTEVLKAVGSTEQHEHNSDEHTYCTDEEPEESSAKKGKAQEKKLPIAATFTKVIAPTSPKQPPSQKTMDRHKKELSEMEPGFMVEELRVKLKEKFAEPKAKLQSRPPAEQQRGRPETKEQETHRRSGNFLKDKNRLFYERRKQRQDKSENKDWVPNEWSPSPPRETWLKSSCDDPLDPEKAKEREDRACSTERRRKERFASLGNFSADRAFLAKSKANRYRWAIKHQGIWPLRDLWGDPDLSKWQGPEPAPIEHLGILDFTPDMRKEIQAVRVEMVNQIHNGFLKGPEIIELNPEWRKEVGWSTEVNNPDLNGDGSLKTQDDVGHGYPKEKMRNPRAKSESSSSSPSPAKVIKAGSQAKRLAKAMPKKPPLVQAAKPKIIMPPPPPGPPPQEKTPMPGPPPREEPMPDVKPPAGPPEELPPETLKHEETEQE